MYGCICICMCFSHSQNVAMRFKSSMCRFCAGPNINFWKLFIQLEEELVWKVRTHFLILKLFQLTMVYEQFMIIKIACNASSFDLCIYILNLSSKYYNNQKLYVSAFLLRVMHIVVYRSLISKYQYNWNAFTSIEY